MSTVRFPSKIDDRHDRLIGGGDRQRFFGDAHDLLIGRIADIGRDIPVLEQISVDRAVPRPLRHLDVFINGGIDPLKSDRYAAARFGRD